jgi:sulfur relay (sulfurtransferase) complex TusBCD TusD component (DsrE family)
MKLGIILYSNDPETVFQTFRLGTASLKKGDEVSLFMLAKGVECDTLDNEKWHISEQMRDFQEHGGKTLSCTSCLEIRQRTEAKGCSRSTIEDLHRMIEESDKLLTF